MSIIFETTSHFFFAIILCWTGYQATVYLKLPPESETKWPFDASNGLQVGGDLRGRGPCLMGGRVSAPPAALSLDVTPTSRALPWTLKLLGLGLCGTTLLFPSWQEQIVTLARKALHMFRKLRSCL